ncbi:hypothetical protein CLU79DRAFT_760147 [Phycomyces nitens]|nr:hypothetical protein CLU79DRAFT_760147 [Phycomyces nitens]
MILELLFFVVFFGVPYWLSRKPTIASKKPQVITPGKQTQVKPVPIQKAGPAIIYPQTNPFSQSQPVKNPADKEMFDGKGSDAPRAFWDTVARRASTAVIGNTKNESGNPTLAYNSSRPFTSIESQSTSYDRSGQIVPTVGCPFSCNAKPQQQQQQPQQQQQQQQQQQPQQQQQQQQQFAPITSQSIFKPTTGLFTSALPQKPAAPKQPEDNSLLSLKNSFPEVNVPHFIVSPEGVTRTELTANMFNRKSSKADALLGDQRPQNNNLPSRHLSSMYSVKENMLPPFLTATSNSHQRRVTQAVGDGIAENVKEKSTANKESLPGIFNSTGHTGYGFVRNAKGATGGQDKKPPAASLWTSGLAKPAPEQVYKPQQLFVTQNDSFLNPLKINNQPTNTALNVFGFPPDMLKEMVAKFQALGASSEPEVICPDWFRIRYENPVHANEALKMNTTFIRSGYILGVKPVEEVPVRVINTTSSSSNPIGLKA